MSVFTNAGQAEILRSAQKDEMYVHHLRSVVSNVCRSVIGIENWLKCRRVLEALSELVYYSATTLSGLQTLGEEYVNIVQTDSTLRKVPTLLARLLSVSSSVSSPIILDLGLKRLEKALTSRPAEQLPLFLRTNLDATLCLLHLIQKSVPVVHKLHSVLFFLFGKYYHISKRIFLIKYVILRAWLREDSSKEVYRILGLLSLLQFVISLVIEYFSKNANDGFFPRTVPEISDSEKGLFVDNKSKCPLCLAKRRSPTATPCGHLFCWTCISSWMDQKRECPLCRETFASSRLVCLQNFE